MLYCSEQSESKQNGRTQAWGISCSRRGRRQRRLLCSRQHCCWSAAQGGASLGAGASGAGTSSIEGRSARRASFGGRWEIGSEDPASREVIVASSVVVEGAVAL